MLTDIKLSEAQLLKIIQSGGFFCKTIENLGKKVLLDLPVPLVKDVLFKLVAKATSSVLDKLKKKEKEERWCKSKKRVHFDYLKWRYGWYY